MDVTVTEKDRDLVYIEEYDDYIAALNEMGFNNMGEYVGTLWGC